MFWHEVFHNYQDSLYGIPLIDSKVTAFENVRANVKSLSFIAQVKEEQRILTQALETQNGMQKRKLICDKFVGARKKRYSTMKSDAVISEKFYEASEGTARYVEELMSLAAGKYFSV